MNKSETQLAYSRGYYAGSKHVWPNWLPPTPPQAEVAAMIVAARALRNAIDNKLATLDENDDWNTELGPLIDQWDEKEKAVLEWIRANP